MPKPAAPVENKILLELLRKSLEALLDKDCNLIINEPSESKGKVEIAVHSKTISIPIKDSKSKLLRNVVDPKVAIANSIVMKEYLAREVEITVRPSRIDDSGFTITMTGLRNAHKHGKLEKKPDREKPKFG